MNYKCFLWHNKFMPVMMKSVGKVKYMNDSFMVLLTTYQLFINLLKYINQKNCLIIHYKLFLP
jgi:hypothetical protein